MNAIKVTDAEAIEYIDNLGGAAGLRGLFRPKRGLPAVGDACNSVLRRSHVYRFVLPAILCALFLCLDFVGPTTVFGLDFKVTPAAEITINSDGQHLSFPTAVFYDRSVDETYVVDGGRSVVVVYAPNDFFPLVTFGRGRGIYSPLSGFVDSERGLVYICQNPLGDKPARITVFNGAFMAIRQIYFDDIPGVHNFIPTHVVVSRDGLMYVVGRQVRGVAVLDSDGIFLRWLRPTDRLMLSASERAAMKGVPMKRVGANGEVESSDSSEEQPAKKNPSGSSAKQSAKKNSDVDIPAQFRPKTKEEKEAEGGTFIVPLKITSISIDKEGRLYVLSDETSKTYVYSPEETFLFSFGTKGGGPRMLSTPRGVAVDDKRHLLYVVDFMRHEILVYSQKDGAFLFEFGGKGTGPGWFNFPNDITVNRRGQVIVSDLFNHRVQVLDVKYQANAISSGEGEQTSPPQKGGGGEGKAAAGDEQGKPSDDNSPTGGN